MLFHLLKIKVVICSIFLSLTIQRNSIFTFLSLRIILIKIFNNCLGVFPLITLFYSYNVLYQFPIYKLIWGFLRFLTTYISFCTNIYQHFLPILNFIPTFSNNFTYTEFYSRIFLYFTLYYIEFYATKCHYLNL